MESLIPLVLIFGLMWALLIRPQQKRVRQHQAVVSSLRPGDVIVTAGGIHGVVVSVEDDALMVEVAPELELKVLRAAVSQRLSTMDDDDESDESEADGESETEES